MRRPAAVVDAAPRPPWRGESLRHARRSLAERTLQLRCSACARPRRQRGARGARDFEVVVGIEDGAGGAAVWSNTGSPSRTPQLGFAVGPCRKDLTEKVVEEPRRQAAMLGSTGDGRGDRKGRWLGFPVVARGGTGEHRGGREL